jgi:hypothetical protein
LLEELEKVPPPLRRSTRLRRSNSKFANATMAEEDLEQVTYEEAAKKDKWRKAMEEEMTELRQNQI